MSFPSASPSTPTPTADKTSQSASLPDLAHSSSLPSKTQTKVASEAPPSSPVSLPSPSMKPPYRFLRLPAKYTCHYPALPVKSSSLYLKRCFSLLRRRNRSVRKNRTYLKQRGLVSFQKTASKLSADVSNRLNANDKPWIGREPQDS